MNTKRYSLPVLAFVAFVWGNTPSLCATISAGSNYDFTQELQVANQRRQEQHTAGSISTPSLPPRPTMIVPLHKRMGHVGQGLASDSMQSPLEGVNKEALEAYVRNLHTLSQEVVKIAEEVMDPAKRQPTSLATLGTKTTELETQLTDADTWHLAPSFIMEQKVIVMAAKDRVQLIRMMDEKKAQLAVNRVARQQRRKAEDEEYALIVERTKALDDEINAKETWLFEQRQRRMRALQEKLNVAMPIATPTQQSWPSWLSQSFDYCSGRSGGYLTTLTEACEHGDIDALEALLKQPNYCAYLSKLSREVAQQGLHLACQAGNTMLVKLIIDSHLSLDINAYNREGYTLLLLAVTATGDTYADLVECLLVCGADPNMPRSSTGRTPLWEACFIDNLSVVHALLAYGSDIEAIDRTGFTPLMIACAKGHELVVSQLLNHGANARFYLPSNPPLTPEIVAMKVRDSTTTEEKIQAYEHILVLLKSASALAQ